MTMVRNDHHWARLWLRYYQSQVESRTDLYVIIHGQDDYLRDLFQGCSVIHAPLEEGGLENFERKRLDFEHFMVRGLQAYFQCVLIVDIDEFVTAAPDIGVPLWQYLPKANSGEMVRSALGFEVVDREIHNNPSIDMRHSILSQRPWAFCNAQYSKPCVFYFNFGGATHHRVWDAPWIIDPNLLLFHMRYCDRILLDAYVSSRKKLFSEQRDTGSPSSRSWRMPWKQYKKLTQEVEQRDEGILDDTTRYNLKRKILQNFVDTNRVGDVSSGYLKLPEVYHNLF